MLAEVMGPAFLGWGRGLAAITSTVEHGLDPTHVLILRCREAASKDRPGIARDLEEGTKPGHANASR